MTRGLMQLLVRRGDAGASSALQGQQGYVLLFVLGLLVLVATLVLSVTVGLRLDAQLLGREKSALQEEYLLRGAARYTAMQLDISAALDAQRADPRDPVLGRWVVWRPSGARYEVTLDKTAISVELEDVSGLPDANMLNQQEWERLFLFLGAPTQENARTLASKVLALRTQLRTIRESSPGFSSLQDLLQWQDLPLAMAYGGTPQAPVGLLHLLVVGTRSKQVDLDTTPLAWLPILGNVTEPHLHRLSALRKAGPVSAAQAQQWLAGTGLSVRPPGARAAVVRAQLRLDADALGTRSLMAVMISENGSFHVVDELINPGWMAR